MGSALAAAGVLVAIGLFTSYAGAAVALAAAYLALYLAPAPRSPESAVAACMVVVAGVAVALIGPGAFSVDSRLFGRREIIIPRDNDPGSSWQLR